MNATVKRKMSRCAAIYNAVQDLNATQRACLADLVKVTLILVEERLDSDPMQWRIYIFTNLHHYILDNTGLMQQIDHSQILHKIFVLDRAEDQYLLSLLKES